MFVRVQRSNLCRLLLRTQIYDKLLVLFGALHKKLLGLKMATMGYYLFVAAFDAAIATMIAAIAAMIAAILYHTWPCSLASPTRPGKTKQGARAARRRWLRRSTTEPRASQSPWTAAAIPLAPVARRLCHARGQWHFENYGLFRYPHCRRVHPGVGLTRPVTNDRDRRQSPGLFFLPFFF